MKKVLMMITVMILTAVSADAMSYEQARREALFLTDKMAYELNLTDEQYEAAYEINLDYLMGVTSRNDVFGTYWTRRNLDISYILLDWQWNAFRAATYFYRPLYWSSGYWHFGIYARYPRRDYFYFGRPAFYVSYRGGHSWRHYNGGSYYHGRRNDFHRGNGHAGLRDRWDKGDFRNGRTGSTQSSTHVTVNRGDNGSNGKHSFGGSRTGGTFSGNSTGTQTGRPSSGTGTPAGKPSTGHGTFGGNRTGGSISTGKFDGSVKSAAGTLEKQRGTTATKTTTTTTPARQRTGSVSREAVTERSSRSSGSFGLSRSTGSTQSRPAATTQPRSVSSTQMRSSGTFGGATRSNTGSISSHSGSMRSSSGTTGKSAGNHSGSSKGTFGGRR